MDGEPDSRFLGLSHVTTEGNGWGTRALRGVFPPLDDVLRPGLTDWRRATKALGHSTQMNERS